MKKIHLLALLLIAAASFNEVHAQTINMPADSVKALLCRKWDFDYVIEEGQKLGAMPGAPTMNYAFKKDGTILATVNGSKNTFQGTWIYDAAKRSIRLTVNKQSRITISSLTKEKLVLLIDMKDVTPSDPTMTMYYKPGSN